VTLLVFLLFCSAFGAAEPGGNGDGMRDMQCGGACHGDASINETSEAILSLSSQDTIYLDIPTTLTLTATNLETSPTRLIGLFLLTDVTGHSDTPKDAGWEILSDENGGSVNYVERTLSSGQNETTISWVVRASSLGPTSFYAAIHHGGASSSPFFGMTARSLDVSVEPVPEDLPRLAADYTPPTKRLLNTPTDLTILTEYTDTLEFEWMGDDGLVRNSLVNTSGEDSWTVSLPAALQPTTIQWRVIMEGDGPAQTSPWFTLTAEQASWEVSENAVYLQAFALLFMTAGIVIILQTRYASTNQISKYDHAPAVLESDASDVDLETTVSNSVAPLPVGGLPDGWTEQQWEWYGYDYLAGKYGGGET